MIIFQKGVLREFRISEWRSKRTIKEAICFDAGSITMICQVSLGGLRFGQSLLTV